MINSVYTTSARHAVFLKNQKKRKSGFSGGAAETMRPDAPRYWVLDNKSWRPGWRPTNQQPATALPGYSSKTRSLKHLSCRNLGNGNVRNRLCPAGNPGKGSFLPRNGRQGPDLVRPRRLPLPGTYPRRRKPAPRPLAAQQGKQATGAIC